MIIRSSLSSLLVLGIITFGAACQSTEGEKASEGQDVSNSESVNDDEAEVDDEEDDDTDDLNADDSNEENADEAEDEGDEGAAVLVPCDKEIVLRSEDAAGQPCLTTDAFIKSLKLSRAQVQRFKALAKKSVVAH